MPFPNQGSKKKSDFIGETQIPNNAFFDFFNSGNFKISKADFIAEMGAAGTVSGIGDPAGTAIYNQNGTDNQIRSLLAGPGIRMSISPLGSVDVEHNFISGTPGLPVLLDAAEVQPILASLVASTGISLAAGPNGSIIISATGVTTPTNTIIINEEADFPIQDATTITLSAGTRFVIGASFSTAKEFIGGEGFVLTAENVFGPVLTYTGTDAMFTNVDISFTIAEITLDSPNATQTFNCSDSTGTKILEIDTVIVKSTTKWGTYTGFLITSTKSCGAGDADEGLTIAGTGQVTTGLNEFTVVSTSPTFKLIDFGSAVVPNIELINSSLSAPAGAVVLAGATSSDNVPTDFLAMMIGSSVSGGASMLSGIAADDIRWRFTDNPGLTNTRPDGLLSMVDNTAETIITASSTDGSNAVKVVGTWDLEISSHFTADSTGRITYNGETPFRAPIDFSINGIMASGPDNPAAAYIAINGVVIRPTESRASVSASSAESMGCHWQHTFQTGDYAEIFIENQSDDTNIIGISGVGRIN